MIVQVAQAQALALVQDHAQDAVPAWTVADTGFFCLGQPGGDKFGQVLAGLVGDAQGGVTGIREIGGGA